jgi:hypothetical protein
VTESAEHFYLRDADVMENNSNREILLEKLQYGCACALMGVLWQVIGVQQAHDI